MSQTKMHVCVIVTLLLVGDMRDEEIFYTLLLFVRVMSSYLYTFMYLVPFFCCFSVLYVEKEQTQDFH